ncbi:unnamed protein product [Closterium sp. NIES-54]
MRPDLHVLGLTTWSVSPSTFLVPIPAPSPSQRQPPLVGYSSLETAFRSRSPPSPRIPGISSHQKCSVRRGGNRGETRARAAMQQQQQSVGGEVEGERVAAGSGRDGAKEGDEFPAELARRLRDLHQEHIEAQWRELNSAEERARLVEAVEAVDVERAVRVFQASTHSSINGGRDNGRETGERRGEVPCVRACAVRGDEGRRTREEGWRGKGQLLRECSMGGVK